MEGSPSALGFVGFAFAEQAGDQVKEIQVDGGERMRGADRGDTIADGSYPLSRSLYIYVNKEKLASNPALKAYVDLYLSDEGSDTAVAAGRLHRPCRRPGRGDALDLGERPRRRHAIERRTGRAAAAARPCPARRATGREAHGGDQRVRDHGLRDVPGQHAPSPQGADRPRAVLRRRGVLSVLISAAIVLALLGRRSTSSRTSTARRLWSDGVVPAPGPVRPRHDLHRHAS